MKSAAKERCEFGDRFGSELYFGDLYLGDLFNDPRP
jgi:hypothetical protein